MNLSRLNEEVCLASGVLNSPYCYGEIFGLGFDADEAMAAIYGCNTNGA